MKNVQSVGNSTRTGSSFNSDDRICTNARARFDNWFDGQCFPGHDFNSRTDTRIHSENYRCIRCDFDIWSVDAADYDIIYHRNFRQPSAVSELIPRR